MQKLASIEVSISTTISTSATITKVSYDNNIILQSNVNHIKKDKNNMNDNNMNATPPTITTAKATMGDHDIIISNNESLLEKTSIPQHISDPTFHQISKRPLRVPALKDLYSIRPSRWKQIQQKVMKYYNPTNTTMKVCHVGSI